MFTVERHYSKFRVKISEPGTQYRGFTVDAADIAEVHKALDHYYGEDQAHFADDSACPICRLVKKGGRT